MKLEIITKKAIKRRRFWINEISRLNSGNFGKDAEKLQLKLHNEIKSNGLETLLDHLRLCGSIPEKYGHDTSEEKLYSKYTDIIIHEAFMTMGFKSTVLKERADVADVECVHKDYSFIADAKAFRLSRTAKNQKDFKVQAMDNWKNDKDYAIIVCPVYQLPSRTSQIYLQSAARSVCISTYTHLAVLIRYAKIENKNKARKILHEVFKTVEAMNPSKNATDYWQAINKTILNFDTKLKDIWKEEKKASVESIYTARKEALTFLALERKRILKLSREEAIKEVLKASKIENRISAIESVSYNGLLEIGG